MRRNYLSFIVVNHSARVINKFQIIIGLGQVSHCFLNNIAGNLGMGVESAVVDPDACAEVVEDIQSNLLEAVGSAAEDGYKTVQHHGGRGTGSSTYFSDHKVSDNTIREVKGLVRNQLDIKDIKNGIDNPEKHDLHKLFSLGNLTIDENLKNLGAEADRDKNDNSTAPEVTSGQLIDTTVKTLEMINGDKDE